MSVSFQRLLIILFSLILIVAALILILTNSKKNIVFFYTPSELIKSGGKINEKVRIGGFVKQNSIKKISIPNEHTTFIVTDNENDINVEYNGILPDMFKEKQGAVVEGILVKKNRINANKVFAKHDENYMPATIKKQLEETNYWKKNYSLSDLSYEKIPEFTTKNLIDDNLILTSDDIKDKITLINFFASWCLPCMIEHPLLIDLKNNFPRLTIIGINHKDKKEDAVKYLSTNGNPYSFVGVDFNGKIGLEFGVFGLPETYLTNSVGDIIYKLTGPLSNEIIQKEIIPNL